VGEVLLFPFWIQVVGLGLQRFLDDCSMLWAPRVSINVVVTQVEVEMILLQSGQRALLCTDQIDVKDVRMQSPNSQADGNIDVKLAAPAGCVGARVVLDLELLWVVVILGADWNWIEVFATDKSEANLKLRHGGF